MKMEDERRVEIFLTLAIFDLDVTASVVSVAKDFLDASILELFYIRVK